MKFTSFPHAVALEANKREGRHFTSLIIDGSEENPSVDRTGKFHLLLLFVVQVLHFKVRSKQVKSHSGINGTSNSNHW